MRGDRGEDGCVPGATTRYPEILRRLADSEETYTTAYVELVGLRIGKLTAYYSKNWHSIRLERVQGMKHNKFSMLNSTNN